MTGNQAAKYYSALWTAVVHALLGLFTPRIASSPRPYAIPRAVMPPLNPPPMPRTVVIAQHLPPVVRANQSPWPVIPPRPRRPEVPALPPGLVGGPGILSCPCPDPVCVERARHLTTQPRRSSR